MFTTEGSKSSSTIVDSRKTGEFLAALRRAAGYTQQEMADYLGITNKTVSKWESGAGLPEISILPAVAELYGVTVDEILAGKRLERTVQSESDASERPKDRLYTARRQWMVTTLNKKLCAGQIVLWCTVIAGFAVLYGLYSGLNSNGNWITVTYGVVWLLFEIMGAALIYIQLRHNRIAASAENGEEKKTLQLCLHRYRMKLALPIVLAVAAVIPLVWPGPYLIPADLRAPFEEIQAGGTLLEFVSDNLGLASPRIYMNGKGLATALPPALLFGSSVWLLADLTGQALIHRIGRQDRRRLLYPAGLVLLTALLFVGLWRGGKSWEQDRSVLTISFESREEFDDYVETYLEVYRSYAAYSEDDWPEVVYGTEVIDNSYLDGKMILSDRIHSERYERFQGVIGFDYDGLSVYKVSSWPERVEIKTQTVEVSAGVCLAALAVFWIVCRRFQKKRFL